MCGVSRCVCVKCMHDVCWCHAGVTGMCVMSSALPGVAFFSV